MHAATLIRLSETSHLASNSNKISSARLGIWLDECLKAHSTQHTAAGPLNLDGQDDWLSVLTEAPSC